jgi:hypothetical protein
MQAAETQTRLIADRKLRIADLCSRETIFIFLIQIERKKGDNRS